jgi:nucleoside-diphosphate-sugar epimerase
VGASEFGTMAETLQALVDHAATGSRVRSIPSAPARIAMRVLSGAGQAPFAPYHWLMFGESLYFDTSKVRTELGWKSTHSNTTALIESYEWFLSHRQELGGSDRSHHRSPVRLGLLELLKRLP